jgi:hypothetical protein
MQPDEDMDFSQSLQDMLGMDEDAVNDLIEGLDADALAELNDAVANEDQARVKEIAATAETNEKVNPLFRGDIDDDDEPQQKRVRKVSDDYGYKFGDDVQVQVADPQTGEMSQQDGTVYLPKGPHDTVGVKIQGKSMMVKRDKLNKLEEQVLGMTIMPNLERMQQLAGIQPAGQSITPEIAVPDAQTDAQAETDPCTAAQQAMDALDVIQTVLPNVRLVDLKTIRQRIISLQAAMNEGASERARKL